MRDWPGLTADRAAPRIIDLQAGSGGKGAAARALGCCRLVRPCAEGSIAGVVEALEKM